MLTLLTIDRDLRMTIELPHAAVRRTFQLGKSEARRFGFDFAKGGTARYEMEAPTNTKRSLWLKEDQQAVLGVALLEFCGFFPARIKDQSVTVEGLSEVV